MDLLSVLPYVFFANAFAHIISFLMLRSKKVSNFYVAGVFAFIFINLGIGILLMQNIGWPWAKYLALIFPAMGGTALSSQMITKKAEGNFLNYFMVFLDVISVAAMVYLIFLR